MRQQHSQQSATERQQKLLWQRKHSVPEETLMQQRDLESSAGFGSSFQLPVGTGNSLISGSSIGTGSSRSNSSNCSRSRSESVLSTSSSNETLRYNENDIGNSFDSSETVIQPPIEFFDNTTSGNESVDLKRFPLGTTYQSQLTQNEDSIQVKNLIIFACVR